jgi:hypothetical protein
MQRGYRYETPSFDLTAAMIVATSQNIPRMGRRMIPIKTKQSAMEIKR